MADCDSDQRGRGSVSVPWRSLFSGAGPSARGSIEIKVRRSRRPLSRLDSISAASASLQGAERLLNLGKLYLEYLLFQSALQRLVFTACRLITDCSRLEMESNHLLSLFLFIYFFKEVTWFLRMLKCLYFAVFWSLFRKVRGVRQTVESYLLLRLNQHLELDTIKWHLVRVFPSIGIYLFGYLSDNMSWAV